MKIKFSITFKVLISVGMIAFLIYRADWRLIGAKLESVSSLLIGFAVMMAMVSVILSSLKWKLLLSINGINFKLQKLIQYYFISMFFNNFLPTRIGGDVYRICKTYDNPKSKTGAVVAVVTERLTGVFAVTSMGTIAALISYIHNGEKISGITALIGSICILTGIIVVFFAYYGKLGAFLLNKRIIPAKIKMAINNLREYAQQPFKTFQAFVLSFIFYVATIIKFAVFFMGISEPCSVITITVALLVSSVISMIPLSLNGIGLLEGGFIVAIQSYGVHYDSALTVMLINRSVILFMSVIGAIVYMCDNRKAVCLHPVTPIHQITTDPEVFPDECPGKSVYSR